MVWFIVRRVIGSFFVLLASTVIMYVLTALSGDPLSDLRELPAEARQEKMEERIERMDLDVPIPLRYLHWLGALLQGDLGETRNGQSVQALLGQAASATLQLVIAATILAIVVGVTVGVISALRQYSGFDYGVTLSAFVFFSLPVFWIATMLKQYAAIEFNNWLDEPVIPPLTIAIVAICGGLMWASLMVGDRRTRLAAFGVGAVATGAVLTYLSMTRWFADPGLGFGFILVVGVGTAVGVTTLFAGLRSGGPLFAACAAAVIGAVSHPVLQDVLTSPTWLMLLGCTLLTIAVCTGLGLAFGGLERKSAVLVAVLSGLFTAGLVFLDHMLRAFAGYSDYLRGRPIATIGSTTPNFEGTFWEHALDSASHLMLPIMALILISLATYTRYTRASMLEVLGHDYVRTARAKGLGERTVITRHVFRNGLIPITTLMAYDFGQVIGGAVITETVFGWEGMGKLFIKGLEEVDPNPVMAFFLITGGSIVVFNTIADIAYAYLDPRIRLS